MDAQGNITAPELHQTQSGPDANDLAQFMSNGSTFRTSVIAVKELPDGKTWVFYVHTGTVNRAAEAVLLTPDWIPDAADIVEFSKPEGTFILRASVIRQ